MPLSRKKLWLISIIAALVLLYLALNPGQVFSLEALKSRQAQLELYRAQHPVLSAVIFFGVYVSITALSLPGATPMTLAGGALFGLGWGTVLVSFASSTGATLAFLVSRFLLRDWVTKQFGQRLHTINEGIRKEGAWYLFGLRLMPVFPFFLVNLLLGLTSMQTSTFYWVSQLGMLAATLAYVNAGKQLASIDSLSAIVSPMILLSFALLGILPLLIKKIITTICSQHLGSNNGVATSISIIVPVLNEATGISSSLLPLQKLREKGVQLIVVDGGSTDETVGLAELLADRVVIAPRGRARQMNAGAKVATGQILLFLHADTCLPDNADALIGRALNPQSRLEWGRFNVKITGHSEWLTVISALMNLRSRLTGIATGDQAIFVLRRTFDAIGGYANIPLMEDVELCKRLLMRSRPACLAALAVTSGRRWERHGIWHTVKLMWQLRLQYFFGADPALLAEQYGYTPSTDKLADSFRIVIMAKAPIPGEAKTRLIPLLGATGAAALQRWLLQRAVATAVAADVGPIDLWYTGAADHPEFEQCCSYDKVTQHEQPAGDLGLRMLAAATHAAASQGVLIIGTDCPVLTAELLQQAASVLSKHDAVVIPAEDGGYVLIGIQRAAAELFAGVDWGSEQVMAQTRKNLTGLGWSWLELPTLWDVDRPADFQRLATTMPAEWIAKNIHQPPKNF